MAYLLYFLVFLTICGGTALYFTRGHWMHHVDPYIDRLPFSINNNFLYSRLPGPARGASFQDDAEQGLHSSDFSLADNLVGEDSRGGLDDAAKKEVLRIMKRRGMNFDQARAVYMERRFAANGISADGMPRDPKFVSFS